MKVEHLTLPGLSVIRDTDEILPKAVLLFEPFQAGSLIAPIENYNFICRISLENGVAVFNLENKEESIFYQCVCCFGKEEQEPALKLLQNLFKDNPAYAGQPFRQPSEPAWMYTQIIDTSRLNLDDKVVAMELMFYLYDAIRRGIEKRAGLSQRKETASELLPMEHFASSAALMEPVTGKIKGKNYAYHVGQLYPDDNEANGEEKVRTQTSTVFFDVLYYSPPDPECIGAWKKSPLRYGLFVEENIPFFLIEFPDMKWRFYCSLNFHLVSENHTNLWLNSTYNIITLYLLHYKTNTILAMRTISIKPAIAERLRDILETQLASFTSANEVENRIQRIQSRFSTSQMIKKTNMFKL